MPPYFADLLRRKVQSAVQTAISRERRQWGKALLDSTNHEIEALQKDLRKMTTLIGDLRKRNDYLSTWNTKIRIAMRKHYIDLPSSPIYQYAADVDENEGESTEEEVEDC